MRTIILFILGLLFFQSHYGQSKAHQSLLIKKRYTDNANSCIRHYSTHINIESIDKMVIKHKQIITVFNAYGNNDIDAYLYYDDNIKVKDIYALAFDASGKEIKKFKKKDFRDVSAVDGGTLYSDSRLYFLDYTPLDYPYTIEFGYEIKNTNTAFINPWLPVLNYYQSVEHSEFIILNETQALLRHKPYNLDFFKGISIENTTDGLSLKADDLPAVRKENYSPSFSFFMPRVNFALTEFSLEGVQGSASSWKEMGKWQYEKLIKGRDVVSEKTQQEIRELTRGIDDPLEKAKIVYQYVQDRTRYISVQVGIGGWQPIDAETVDKVKYGDCKGLTNYTKALLKIAGIDAKYTVVFAGSEKKDLDEDFTSMQGNHVILNVPLENQELWLECTSQDIPFGFLGNFTDDRKVLVIDESGGKIKTTNSYIGKDNAQFINAYVDLKKSGTLDVNFKIRSTGTQFYNKYRLTSKNDKEIKKHYQNYYDHLKDLEIENYQFFKDEDHVEFTEELNFETINYGSKFGNRLMFKPNVLNQSIGVPDKYNERITPFQISRGFYDEDHLIFNIPQNMQVESLPKSISLDTKFGKYKADFLYDESGDIIYNRKLLLKQGEFSNDEYSDFRVFMKEIKKADQAKIILIQKT